MKNIKELELIFNDLESLEDIYKEDLGRRKVINLLRKKLTRLTNKESTMLLASYDLESFDFLIPYIERSFKFYKSRDIVLNDLEKEELIINYIFNYDQILSSRDDLFESFEEQSEILFNDDLSDEVKHCEQ